MNMDHELEQTKTRVLELEEKINTMKRQMMRMIMGGEEGKGKGKKAGGEKDEVGNQGIAGCLATVDWVIQDREHFAVLHKRYPMCFQLLTFSSGRNG